MNTSALKSFAPLVRRQLMEAVAQKLDFVLSTKTPDYLTTFAPQVAALRKLAQNDRDGLIERVAYTWFNRFAALRYLDARGWHPFRYRVLTPAGEDQTQPEILKVSLAGPLPEELREHTNPRRLNDLLDGRIPSFNPQGEVYRHLVLAACRFYHALLPDLFERLGDETELLLPDDLLTEQSIVQGFRTEITDGDCAEVEVLGWLYQFYISEKKDAVMGRKAAVPTEDIPAVTQLFTPHWIVRYLVENSLGRLWLLNRPASRLRDKMLYYVEGNRETDFLRIGNPEEIRLLDPAVGSGHMLTYAFDLLFGIYEEEGYAPADIPELILTHNLYGVDICPRAAQLAALALVLKAREHTPRFSRVAEMVHPRILCMEDVRFGKDELRASIDALNLGEVFTQQVIELLCQFEQATTIGSLIQPCLDEDGIASVRSALDACEVSGSLFLSETNAKVLRALKQAEYLSRRYEVVVTNPPYMGSKFYNPRLKHFVKDHYSAGQPDIYGCFIQRNYLLTRKMGFAGMITIPNWMFISTFDDLRNFIFCSAEISSLIYCGRGVWGADFGSCAFIMRSRPSRHTVGRYRRLFNRLGEVSANEELIGRFYDSIRFPVFHCSANDFQSIPGRPLAFWITSRERELYARGETLGKYADCKKGLDTGENERFLRFWHEVSLRKCSFSGNDNSKWFPYNKGGEFRKWFGNRKTVINWGANGAEIKGRTKNLKKKPTLRNQDFYLRESFTWGTVTISRFSARYSPKGALFDNGGCSAFATQSDFSIHLIGGILNSNVANRYLDFLAPTVNYQSGDVGRILLPASLLDCKSAIALTVTNCISLARDDWDSFEESWDFKCHPLLRAQGTFASLKDRWEFWKAECDFKAQQMRALETENNRRLIEAYGLQSELDPEVPEDQITLARANRKKDLAALLSYAVGCLMGRYSLDRPGLILANAGGTLEEYIALVDKPRDQLTFEPCENGIIPVLEGEWFEDDIVSRTREFLRIAFGETKLRENVAFIEDSLGKDLRKYFLTDFYKDHLQTYEKRPIYWMVQSPRKGFSVLIYLHRYTRDTINLILNRYLREYQQKLRNRAVHLAQVIANEGGSARAKTEVRREADKIAKTLHECQEWERQIVLPLAQARIELDLDDGVKVNYLKLGEALAPVAGMESKAEE